MSSSQEYASEGFDLDALPGAGDKDNDVVFEIGGGASTVVNTDQTEEKTAAEEDVPPDELAKAEEWKQKGNQEFKQGNYMEAVDLYTNAIDAVPDALSGDEIRKRRDDFRDEQREKSISRHRMSEEDRRRKEKAKKEESSESASGSSTKQETPPPEKPEPAPVFVLEKQPHGEKLAIYYCNRAAASTYMERYDEAVKDCDVSTLLNPQYTKAFVRRSAAYEKSDRTEEALRDAKAALALQPTNSAVRKSVARLQKQEDERIEKLKEETMGKLKDLGNSLLGNFGLSLDNFNAVKDPNTGSYSISFDQNNGQSS